MSWPRRTSCTECGRDLLDARWSPLCPVCYEGIRQEERREHIRPPEVDTSSWADPGRLELGFESALGGELP